MKPVNVLITGAGGYVGSILTQKLAAAGQKVKAFDTYWFGVPEEFQHPNIEIITGDLRSADFAAILENVDQVVHLACISNDPSYELNPEFSEKINWDATCRFIDSCLESEISRFTYASSSSVYGIKAEEQVSEDLSLQPLTPYSLNKMRIENYLHQQVHYQFDYVILRPATVYGYSPRLRLDVVTNIFSSQAFFEKKITIHGGEQFRPQIHIQDMARAYEFCVSYEGQFSGETLNVCETNFSVKELAFAVQECTKFDVEVDLQEVKDPRSYRVSSDRFKSKYGFSSRSNLQDGIFELHKHFTENPEMDWKDPKFHNIQRMKKILQQESES